MEGFQSSCFSVFGIVCFFIWTLNCLYVDGYNIETKKVGLLQGAVNSQFGYSVAFANEPGWKSKQESGERFDKV